MRALIVTAALAALGLSTAAQAAPSVEIKDAVARVVVIPENRTDVKVEFLTTNPDLPMTIETRGDRVIVNGGLRGGRIRDCRSHNGHVTVEVRDVGDVTWEKMPQIVVRTPMNVQVASGSAVFGSIGRSDSVELSNGGCGDWQIANTKGDLRVNIGGSGDTEAGSAASLRVNIGGSGDVRTAEIGGGVDIKIGGSGDVSVLSVDGPLSTTVGGSGDVTVKSGQASDVSVTIGGSGDTTFNGTAGNVRATIAGSGDVRITRVTGEVHKAVVGSGDVIIGH
ncbi:MAG: hypothetical protein JWP35_303 [Caulobacter sp.]|nr:hypothetical protein [Caulobacter sp.]